MHYPLYHSVIQDLNTSIILPFYKKIEEFKRILPMNARFFQRNGVEVIIVMDHQEGKIELLELIRNFPLINWVVIVNEQEHAWRNPAKAINVGIKASTKNYIMVCSPESQFVTDALIQLRYAINAYEPCFAIGTVKFKSFGAAAEDIMAKALPYGSLLVAKSHIEKVNGYSEQFENWGGEDDNIRAKFEANQIKKIMVADVIMIHYELSQQGYEKRENKANLLSAEVLRRSYYPERSDFINKGWGSDFKKIIFDYKAVKAVHDLCEIYLRKFKKFFIADLSRFNSQHQIIALVQTYNEAEQIESLLIHLDSVCDGVILLDDDSTDGTYELAQHACLLAKFQKERTGFDDLQNRNFLLDVTSFVNCEWAFFIDADERFDVRYSNLREAAASSRDEVIAFWLVNTWNSKDYFRTDLDDTGAYSHDGIFSRSRMFKTNKGRTQLNLTNDRKLHFLPIPGHHVPKPTNLLLIHTGMQSEDCRKKKYEFYMLQDKDATANYHKHYKHLNDNTAILKRIEAILL